MLRLGPSTRKIMSYLSYISLSWWSVEWSKSVSSYVSISHIKGHAHKSHGPKNQIDLMMRSPMVGVEILATIKWVEVSWWYYHFHMGSIDNQFPHFCFASLLAWELSHWFKDLRMWDQCIEENLLLMECVRCQRKCLVSVSLPPFVRALLIITWKTPRARILWAPRWLRRRTTIQSDQSSSWLLVAFLRTQA